MIDGNPVGTLISIATLFVAVKYPDDFRNPEKKKDIFEMCEMVRNELADKNFDVICERCYKNFASIEDINFGGK